MVFISICEACIIYYKQNKDNRKHSFRSIFPWYHYFGRYICGNMGGTATPVNVFKLQFHIFDYLGNIYGFNDTECLPLMIEFFKSEKYLELHEIAELTLHIQTHQRL